MMPNTIIKPLQTINGSYTNIAHYITLTIFPSITKLLQVHHSAKYQIGGTTLNLLEMNHLFNIFKLADWQYRN